MFEVLATGIVISRVSTIFSALNSICELRTKQIKNSISCSYDQEQSKL